MIPNVFISSTVSDLQYLRDGLREAIMQLEYYPVMSEHGGVGYIKATTAPEACYSTVGQCQLVVLIVGKRYGTVGEDGYSITHREFLAARKCDIPIVTFVEAQVLNYKEVFDTDPSADMWNNFELMDNPRKTFELLDEIGRSPAYNAVLKFTSVDDVKAMLKKQIANFVGDRLNEAVQPGRQDMKEVLAEIKTLRNQFTSSSPAMQEGKAKAQLYLETLRFLLDDKHAEYRSFLADIFGDLDRVIPLLLEAKTFDALMHSADVKLNVVLEGDIKFGGPKGAEMEGPPRIIRGHYTMYGSYQFYEDKTMDITTSLYEKFKGEHESLSARLEMQ